MLDQDTTAPAELQASAWAKPTIAEIPLNSVGHAACALALDGFHVFPLKPADRTPAHRGWQDEASNDVASVAELFPAGCVWAIGLAPWKSGHVVADLDEKHGHRGIAAFEQLERQHGAELTALPPTVLTKSGGQHRYYRFALADTPPRCSIGKLGDGIDIKCRGGFVVAPGSPGYRLAPSSAPLTEAPLLPDWLDALCRQGADAEPRKAAPGVVLDDPARIHRAIEIARLAPSGVEFEGSDNATVALANALLDWVDEDHTTAILIEHWIPRCVGNWDEEYVELKVQNAAASRENDIGCAEFADPAATFGQEKIMKAKVIGRVLLPPGVTAEMVQQVFEEAIGRPLPGLPPGMSADDDGPLMTLEELIEEVNAPDRSSFAYWENATFPTVEPVLGGIISMTSRVMLVAPTGLGKTHFAMAMAGSVAAGKDFLHWSVPAARPVLYLDGEMPKGLMQIRAREMMRRMDLTVDEKGHFRRNMHIISRELYENELEPLNSPAGQKFVDGWLAAHAGTGLIVFDNIQSLLIGELLDPKSWEPVLPWIRKLTAQRIAQIWVHHANEDGTSFGTKTREWQMSSVMTMQRIDNEAEDEAIAFDLHFRRKARERTPANRQDYQEGRVSLEGNSWRFNPAAGKSGIASSYRLMIEARLREWSITRPLKDLELAAMMTGKPKDHPNTQEMRQRLHDLHKGAKGQLVMAGVGRIINGAWNWQLPEFWNVV